jgi:hypothetical protein
MDNRQLRTAMAARVLGQHPFNSYFGYDAADVEMESVSEMASRVKQWRNELGTLSLSIGARGGNEGVWYIDLLSTPQSGFKELLMRFDDAVASYLYTKNPQKTLFFTSDGLSCMFAYKHMFPESEVHFANNQSLFNFETFLRDSSTEIPSGRFRDIDYSVVDEHEISIGDSSGYDFIQVASWDVLYDAELLKRCVSALSGGGVLIALSTNNAGKAYRDDTMLHPYYGMHEVLKQSDGITYHSSDSYGFTVFIKAK